MLSKNFVPKTWLTVSVLALSGVLLESMVQPVWAMMDEEKEEQGVPTTVIQKKELTLTITNLPEELEVSDLFKEFKPRFKSILKHKQEKELVEGKIPRIQFLTSTEARAIFEPYLKKMVEKKHISKENEEEIFTATYFGTQKSVESQEVQDNLKKFIHALFMAVYAEKNWNYNHDKKPPYYIMRYLSVETVEKFMRETIKENDMSYYDYYSMRLEKEKYNINQAILNPDLWKGGEPSKESRFYSPILDDSLITKLHRDVVRMMEITQKGDTLIFFGNTPYLLGRALEIIDKNKERQVLKLPFSGTPNRISAKSYVTLERANYMRQSMADRGVSPANEQLDTGTVYIVDVIFSGAGPAFALELLLREYDQACKPPPHFKILALNKLSYDVHFQDNRQSEILERGSKYMYFPSINKCRFKVPYVAFPVDYHKSLDGELKEYQRYWPEYPAYCWSEEYDYLFDYFPGSLVQPFLQHFDEKIKELSNT